MTTQNNNTTELQTPTLLEKVWDRLLNFDQAMNYDPQEHNYSRMDYLSNEIAELKSKSDQLDVVKNGRVG